MHGLQAAPLRKAANRLKSLSLKHRKSSIIAHPLLKSPNTVSLSEYSSLQGTGGKEKSVAAAPVIR